MAKKIVAIIPNFFGISKEVSAEWKELNHGNIADLYLVENDWEQSKFGQEEVDNVLSATIAQMPDVLLLYGDDVTEHFYKSKYRGKFDKCFVLSIASAYSVEGQTSFWPAYEHQLTVLTDFLIDKVGRKNFFNNPLKYAILCLDEQYPRQFKEHIRSYFSRFCKLQEISCANCRDCLWTEKDDAEEYISTMVSFVKHTVPDLVFVLGYGGKNHLRLLNKFQEIGFAGWVVSNEAIGYDSVLKVVNKYVENTCCFKGGGIFYVDIPSVEKGTLLTLSDVALKLLFRAFIDNGGIKNFFSNIHYFESPIGSISIVNQQISVPLVCKRLAIRRQEYEIDIWKPHVSPNKDSYSIVRYLNDTNDLISKFLVTSNKYTSDVDITSDSVFVMLMNRVAQVVTDSQSFRMLPIYINNQDSRLLLPDTRISLGYLRAIGDFVKLVFCKQYYRMKDPQDIQPLQINLSFEDFWDNGADKLEIFYGSENRWVSPFVLHNTEPCGELSHVRKVRFRSFNGNAHEVIADYDLSIVKAFLDFAINCNDFDNFCYLIPFHVFTNQEYGALMVLSKTKLSYFDLKTLSTTVHQIFSIYSSVVYRLSFEHASIKSAIGSIMSRNGSHNIGSHVLAALSHNVGTMPDDRMLYQYIQHRMDYIATATTDFPTWSSETKLVNGLIRQFLSQRHLLDYIAGSEGLHSFKFQDPNISEDAEQPNTIRLRIRKLDEKGNPHEFIRYKGIEATADFDDDVAVAIPGGVIGGHAFFTILENVIRNAAKHGWAKTSEKKKNYLEIFVDFKCSDSNRTIEIDVYDGLSNVFAISKKKIVAKEGCELTPEENATNKAIENLCVEINKWNVYNECARKPLSASKQNGDRKADEGLLADYLSGKSDVLPEMYNSIKTFLSGDEIINEGGNKLSFKRCKLLSDILIGTTDKDDELGHRLWLPLHHSQQLKLAKQFIDESGALRKENWGLAEIKISAGYLNRRPISEIGGLDKVDPIITPKCEAGADGGAHLSYHFWIPVPREIAFVCDTKDIDSNKITELRSYGIYVVNPPIDGQYVKPKNKGDEDWNYSYVVLPKFPEQKDPHLPFRVLVRDANTKRKDMDNVQCLDMVPSAAGFYDTIKNKLIEGDSTAKDIADTLKKSIYDKWKEYWYSTRRDLGINNIPILEVSAQRKGGNRDKNNGESSLIYNIDVWRFVVRELFRSIVGHFLSDVQAGNVEASKEVLAFLELMSIACKNDAKNAFFSFPGSERLIDQINKQKTISEKLLCELLLKEFLNWFSILKQDCQSQGLVQYCVKLEKFREDYSLKTRMPLAELINDAERIMVLVQSKQCQYDYNRTNPLFIDEEGFDNGLLGFAQRMLNSYREADVMLRKYEERILTLPVIFTKNEGDENAKVHSQGSGGKRIVYERHAGVDDFLPNQMLYHESLSGTQSYIYDLIQYQNITGSQKISTRLYESGLARVVIIDERVSRFLRDRPEMIKTFCHMGIWCVDETNFSDKGNNFHDAILNNNLEAFGSLLVLDKTQIDGFINSFQNESSKSDGETGKNRGEERRKVFDILIIHQGIIDKWLSHAGADCKKVEKFIQKLKMEIPYVVITTGRGTPANIPDSARILPFSIIEATLFKKHPEKLVLVDTIMSILPIGEHQ